MCKVALTVSPPIRLVIHKHRRLFKHMGLAPRIQIEVQNECGDTVYRAKIDTYTSMRKLMVKFCGDKGLPQSSVSFVFDCKRIAPHHTAGTLGLEDGGVIECSML